MGRPRFSAVSPEPEAHSFETVQNRVRPHGFGADLNLEANSSYKRHKRRKREGQTKTKRKQNKNITKIKEKQSKNKAKIKRNKTKIRQK